MRASVRLIAIASIAATLSLRSEFARAQGGPGDSEAHIQRGLELRRQHQDEAAFREFELAWNLSHAPRARAQMGLAAQALGRWSDAERFLREALASRADPWIVERRAVLDQSLTEIGTHLGTLEVRCNIDGALVLVDGAPRGNTPLREPLMLPVGTAAIQVRAPGHIDALRQVTITAGATAREQITLVAIPAVSAPPNQGAPRLGVAPPPTRPVAPSGSYQLRRNLAWTAGGIALGGIVVGSIFLGLRNGAATTFNALNCAERDLNSECISREADVARRQTGAVAGFVLGGAAAVASVVLFVTLPAREAPRTGLLGCAPFATQTGAGALCEGRF